jgi:hypothetical protein
MIDGAAVLLALLLGGCSATVRTPDVEVRAVPVDVRLGGDGGFCPPGQA